MEKQLAGKLLERAAAPVEGDTGEMILTIDHTLTRDNSVPMGGLRFKTDSPARCVALTGR